MEIINWTTKKDLNPDWPSNNRPAGNVKKIIVHHDAVARPQEYDDYSRYLSQAKDMERRMAADGAKGLQYHFKINNIGQIYQIRPFTLTTWHATNLTVNRESVAICLDGNMEEVQPTREQFVALKELLDWLCTKNPQFPADQDDVFGHFEVTLNATACPGKNLRDWVVAYRNSRGNVAVPQVPFNNGTMSNAEAPKQPEVPQPQPETPKPTIDEQEITNLRNQINALTVERNNANAARDAAIVRANEADSTIKNYAEQIKGLNEEVKLKVERLAEANKNNGVLGLKLQGFEESLAKQSKELTDEKNKIKLVDATPVELAVEVFKRLNLSKGGIMSIATKTAAKRALRGALAVIIAGLAAKYGNSEYWLLIAPAINGISKYMREKWGIDLQII